MGGIDEFIIFVVLRYLLGVHKMFSCDYACDCVWELSIQLTRILGLQG